MLNERTVFLRLNPCKVHFRCVYSDAGHSLCTGVSVVVCLQRLRTLLCTLLWCVYSDAGRYCDGHHLLPVAVALLVAVQSVLHAEPRQQALLLSAAKLSHGLRLTAVSHTGGRR